MADLTFTINPYQPAAPPIDEQAITVTSTANAVASAVQLTSTATPCHGVKVRNPGYTKTGGTQQGHAIKVLIAPAGVTAASGLVASNIGEELAPGQAEFFRVGDASRIWFTTADGANSQDIHALVVKGQFQ